MQYAVLADSYQIHKRLFTNTKIREENCSNCIFAAVWCSGSTLVTINVVILHRARLVLEWVTFTSSNRVRTLSVFNQPPRPTQPCHPSGVGKMSTGVKTGKSTAGYAVIRGIE